MAQRQIPKQKIEVKSNFILLIFGAKGYGKSAAIKKALNNRNKLFDRTVIIDVEEEYNCDFRTYTREEFAKTAAAVWDKADKFIIAHTPEDDSDDIFDLVFAIQNCTLIVDEAHHWGRGEAGLNKIIRRGRHRQINVIMITHRPTDLMPIYRLQADMIVSFRQTQKIDIEGFRSFMDNPERLMKLGRDQHLVISSNDTKEINF